ncbi:hypothetical protein C8J56DRAFT_792081 [Mycena floridula]|nr:hypothetical protein C8J56DRAFT_792081 [Mycena floridula]
MISPVSVKFLSLFSCLALVRAQSYNIRRDYLPWTAPKTTEAGQAGTNQCGEANSQSSMCQNAYLNNVNDWCIWAPPTASPDSTIGNTERIEVAWCIKPGYGTRLIPDGAITGAHFVQTPDFVQVTGVGDLTKLNIPAGDAGGELDPHGADGNGNPIGGLVFSNSFGQLEQIHEWTNFVSANEFCFRACKPGPNAAEWCQHIYDVMGCAWNMPASYSAGVFEQCDADSGEPMGVYGTSTFHQGDPMTPDPHPIPASSKCTPLATIGNSVTFSASIHQVTSTTIQATSISASSTSAVVTSAARSSSSVASSSFTTKPTSSAASVTSTAAPGLTQTTTFVSTTTSNPSTPTSGSITQTRFSMGLAFAMFSLVLLS